MLANWSWAGSFSGVTGEQTSFEAFTLYDQPRRSSATEPSLLSIAQLQHVDLTADDQSVSVGHQSGLAVGNSIYPSLLPRELAVATRTATAYAPDWELRP